jgi:hypothetical protein
MASTKINPFLRKAPVSDPETFYDIAKTAKSRDHFEWACCKTQARGVWSSWKMFLQDIIKPEPEALEMFKEDLKKLEDMPAEPFYQLKLNPRGDWQVTINELQTFEFPDRPISYEEAFIVVHMYLTDCVVQITGSKEFMVRHLVSQKHVWIPVSTKKLDELLKINRVLIAGDKKTKMMPLAAFLENPIVTKDLRKFHGRDFANDLDPTVFPVWPGHAHPFVEDVDMELIQPFLDHVRNVICNGNEEYYMTEMMKNAWMFQNPSLHMGWATVLVGEQGGGKNQYTNILCALWGELFCQANINDVKSVTGEKAYNILHYRKLVVLNELPPTRTVQGKKTEWETLKSRITDKTLKTRSMYHDFDLVSERNVTNYIFCTNNIDSILIEPSDRRYFILEVNDMKRGDKKYMKLLSEMAENPKFLSHLLSYLLKIDTSGLDVWEPLRTTLKEEMLESQEPLNLRYIKLDRWRTTHAGGRMGHADWSPFREIWADYRNWVLQDLGLDPDRFCGADNKFAGPLVMQKWIQKRSNVKPAQYRPAEKWIEYRKEQDRLQAEADAEEDEVIIEGVTE